MRFYRGPPRGTYTLTLEHRPWRLQHSTSCKLVLTFLLLLMEAPWPETSTPLLQRSRSPFPIDINFGWPRKSDSPLLTRILKHFFFSIPPQFNTRQIRKINALLSIQLLNILTSQFHTHSFIHQHNWLNDFSFVNTVVKFFPCLFVIWFAALCSILSLQLYAIYYLHKVKQFQVVLALIVIFTHS